MTSRKRTRVRSHVYVVTYHYDDWDHYSIGITHDLRTAKHLAQTEWTERDMGDPVTLEWTKRVSALRSKSTSVYYYADTNGYGAGYQIDRQPVQVLRDVP